MGSARGVELLRRCDGMVGKLGLFSPNETKEDVSTANLKHLLVPYYLAEMTEKIAQDDRIPVLKASQDHFKVARFKRQRAAGTMLQEIKERKGRRVRSLKGAALSAPTEAGEEDDMDDDGEDEREASDLLDMMKKEEEMLLAVKERQAKDGNAFAREMLDERAKKAEAWHQNAANRMPYSKQADPITCATLAQDILEGRASVSQAHEHKHQPLILGPASLVGGGLASAWKERQHKLFSLVTGCQQ